MKFKLTYLMNDRRKIRVLKVNKNGLRVLENLIFDKNVIYNTDDFGDYPQFDFTQYTETIHKRQASLSQVQKYYKDATINKCMGCGGVVTGYTVPVFEVVNG